MPSRLVHAWRAASISARWASTSGVGAHSAPTKARSTSLTSVDDSRDRSAAPVWTPLHHAGGAAAAEGASARNDASDDAALATTTSLFIRFSRLIFSSWVW